MVGKKRSTKKRSKKSSRTSKKTGRRRAPASKPTKGDCRCYYKGNEPSPKGFGYCAHCGRVGQEKFGTDGQRWKIKRRANGSIYWAKLR